MGGEVYSHRISVERVDCGTSLARLDPPASTAGPLPAEAVLALAHTSCGAAIDGMVHEAQCTLSYQPTTSSMTHLRTANGPVSAAALVERELPCYVAHDIRRNGNTHTRVNVAVVDADGDAVALGTFEFFIARR